MKDKSLLIVGGDKRLRFAYETLISKGYECVYENSNSVNALSLMSEYRYILMPFPAFTKNKILFSDNENFIVELERLEGVITDKHIVFGGMFSKEFTAVMDRKNIVYIDLNKNEDFLVYNAFLTAQAALGELIRHSDRALFGKKALLLGFGRVNKALALALKGLSMHIAVCARSESQRILASSMGFDVCSFAELSDVIGEYMCVFNSVPENIFSDKVIQSMSMDALYFELASAPYGVQYECFKNDKRFILSSALPGKYTPRSAGEKIAQTVIKYI